MARQENAGQIINDTAIEVGLVPVNDPYSTQDEAFVQLRGLLNSAGRELVTMFDWEVLQEQLNILTTNADTGIYDLPTNFDRMSNQTAWNLSANLPIAGPLSPQLWAAFTSLPIGPTLTLGFRLSQNKLEVFPQPPPPDSQLRWWYISRNWVVDNGGETTDRAGNSSDVVLYDPILMTKFLKVKFLSAKGYDIAVAAREFDMTLMSLTGQDKGAQVLNVSGKGAYPYLNAFKNIPFTGYGI